MDKKSIFLFSFLLIVVIASGILQYRTFVKQRNYVVANHLSCESSSESCFISDCSPETDEECETEPYKKITKVAKNILACENLEDCAEVVCEAGEEGCTITWCTPESVEEGELCTEPDEEEVTATEEE